MKPENLTPTTDASDNGATEHMKDILSGYDLPESYQRLVNGPWRLVAETILEQYGEESDAWGRMTWFTRILCTAVETSLQRQTPEAVNDALNGFNIWLNSLRDDGESHSMCVSAANYAQRRIATQIAEDTCNEGGGDEADSDVPMEEFTEQTEGVVEDSEALAFDGEETLEIEEESGAADNMDEAAEESQSPELQEDPSLESLSLSLAYSDREPVTDDISTEESEHPLDQFERGTDMDLTSNASLEEKQFGASEPGMDSLSINSRVTEPSSIAPVPMGTWLAFHDQDMPTLARLAIYDPASDSFMLGNKNGILVRQIKKPELLGLVDSGLVQLVEFRSITP